MEIQPKEKMYCVLSEGNEFGGADEAQVLIRPSDDETDLDDNILKELHEESNIGPLVDAVYDGKVAGTLLSVEDLVNVWKIAKKIREYHNSFGNMDKLSLNAEALNNIYCWDD